MQRSVLFTVLTFLLMVVAGTASAIETSSAIRGVVTDESGRPIASSTVTLRSTATSLTRSTQTSSDGTFSIRNLPVGGNYTVTAESSGYESDSVTNLSLNLGQTADLAFSLSSTQTIEEVVVTGSRLKTQVAVGPSASFGLKELETTPAINRNITDVLRIDPRIYIDESRGEINAIQCGGKNSRFNSLTVDGVRTNDLFGLNSNGYPTERMPFSYDAINQVAVELAPFDANYGGFTACNINAVTKSGSNEFSGGFFWDYTDNDLRGDQLEGDDIVTGDFDETRWGFNLGGPIIKDKLFFFAAYEKLEGANLFDRGPIGSNAVNEVPVTQAELDEIVSIARNVYQYDPGPIPSSLANEDEKLLVKLDWYINDTHRASFTYNYNDGNNFTESDGDLDEFEFQNHLYERGAELTSYVGTVYSDWTENFSTQVRLGSLELDNRQISVGGNDFGEMQIDTGDVEVYIGHDDSRQSNKLNYDVVTFAFSGNYIWGDHDIGFGYEREDLEVFNLFLPHTETAIHFDSIDDFRNGLAARIEYNNSPSHNPNAAAADWSYAANALWLQDKFSVLDGAIDITAGLRYDWYSSDDVPQQNDAFTATYGFSNSTNLDGEGLLQPRLGFTWYTNNQLTIRGGLGMYSGGDPNVWLSNNFSNNNVLQFGARTGSVDLFDPATTYTAAEPGVPNAPGYAIPQQVYDSVSTGVGRNFEINYLDPNFELPSEWKYAIGFDYEFGANYMLAGDLLWTRAEDTAIILRGDIRRSGTQADGYPIYSTIIGVDGNNREGSYVLTNSEVGNRSFGGSLFLRKAFDNGMDFTVGYAYNDAEDVSPMTSSVAFSNYNNRAYFDPQEQVLSRSNYNIEHRFTASWNWEATFIGENLTIVSLFGSLNEGPPYSLVADGRPGSIPIFRDSDRTLAPGNLRNQQDGSWFGKVDFRIEQQLNIGPGNASAFLVIDNLTNLINDEWGIQRVADFPGTVAPGDQEEGRIGDSSRYEIRFGVKYDF